MPGWRLFLFGWGYSLLFPSFSFPERVHASVAQFRGTVAVRLGFPARFDASTTQFNTIPEFARLGRTLIALLADQLAVPRDSFCCKATLFGRSHLPRPGRSSHAPASTTQLTDRTVSVKSPAANTVASLLV